MHDTMQLLKSSRFSAVSYQREKVSINVCLYIAFIHNNGTRVKLAAKKY